MIMLMPCGRAGEEIIPKSGPMLANALMILERYLFSGYWFEVGECGVLLWSILLGIFKSSKT